MFLRALIALTAILSLCAVSAAPVKAAHTEDSVTVGLDVVEDFYTETTARLRELGTPGADELIEKTTDLTNRVASSLRSMKWVERPSRRRFEQVYRMVEDYADGRIEAVRALSSGLPPEDRTLVGNAVTELTELKKEKLDLLAKTLSVEAYEKPGPKPVPPMERTPHEGSREEGEGIYFR